MRRQTTLLAAAAVTVAAAGALAVSVPASAAAGCQVTYAVTNQWPGGFGASVTVTNLGDAVSTWRLTWSFTAGQTVTQLWGGTVSQSGARVTVASAGWNGSLGTGKSASFGFNGSWNSTANPAPTDVALNGTVCNGAVGASASTTASSPVPASPAQSSTGASPSASPSSSSSAPSGILDRVHSVGRVRDNGSAVQVTWPGVYFEGRFRGTSVGVVLNDSNNDYVVEVDGITVATLVTPGQTTHWVKNLAAGDHSVRLAKRSESPWAAGEFGGFVAGSGGAILAKPAARTRQIEFIGDSWTAGYGDMSTSRDCSSSGGVNRNTNADLSFGALTAKGLNADYQINAWSGKGMVRNYNGQEPDVTFRTYYETDLQALWNSATWQNPGTWKPQVIVVGLGINDFSTALGSTERWASMDALVADYKAAYLAFLDKLRTRYGTGAYIVLTYPDLSYSTTAFAESVKQIAATRAQQGDTRVRSLYYDNNALGLDLMGCDWHPSLRDHQILATTLTDFIAGLQPAW